MIDKQKPLPPRTLRKAYPSFFGEESDGTPNFSNMRPWEGICKEAEAILRYSDDIHKIRESAQAIIGLMYVSMTAYDLLVQSLHRFAQDVEVDAFWEQQLEDSYSILEESIYDLDRVLRWGDTLSQFAKFRRQL